MSAQRSLFSRTMISLPLPAAILAVGSLGMAWASSSTPEQEPPSKEPAVAPVKGGGIFEASDPRSGKKTDEYWTPARMKSADPAEMPVQPEAAP